MDTVAFDPGQTYVDEYGQEVTLYQIHRGRGVVVLDSEDGRFEMTLEAFAQAIEDGDFEEVDDAEPEDEDEQEQEQEQEADEF